jgi:hypothetical protein
MFLGLSKANDVKIISTLRVGEVDHAPFQPTYSGEPQFTVGGAPVFDHDYRTIEDDLATREIDAVLTQILSALRLIPSWHPLIVATNYDACKTAAESAAGSRFTANSNV